MIRCIVARGLDWLFSIYAALVALVCNLVSWSLLLLVPGPDRRRRIARIGTYMVLWLTGIKLSVEGCSNVPNEPCVAVANHRSYFDGLALICALPPGFSSLIKDAVRRIPGLGIVMARAGSIYVRRTPAAAAGVDTLRMIRRVRQGVSPAIFAEGTLSPDRGLLPLRDGAFLVAARAGHPVVPVAIQRSESVLPPGGRRLRHGRVHVSIGKPCYPEGRRRADARALRERVEAALWRLLSPQTADWRAGMSHSRYIKTVCRQSAWNGVVIDLDTLAERLRRVLGPLPAKPLRLDMRHIGDPILARRINRSDVRITNAVCTDFATAQRLVDTFEFGHVMVWPDSDAAIDQQAGTFLSTYTGQIATVLSEPEQLSASASDAGSKGDRIDIWLALRSSIATSQTERARFETRLEWFLGRRDVVLQGLLLDCDRSQIAMPYELESEVAAIDSACQKLGRARPRISLHGSQTSDWVKRSRLVDELVVGEALATSCHSQQPPLAMIVNWDEESPLGVLDGFGCEASDAARAYVYGGMLVQVEPGSD